MGFWDKLERNSRRRSSLLCVGLDPWPESIPAQYEDVFAFNKAIVDATAEVACAYKPNIAFYEQLGSGGLEALRRTLAYIPSDIPVILDAKRNDIGSTAAAYARAVFEVWGVDAVTVTPYLGEDGIAPFVDYDDRGVFVLCKTSNPSAGELQDWAQAGEPLYRRVAELARGWQRAGQIGLVIGATYADAMAEIRAGSANTWFLVPGVGAQGGDLRCALTAGVRPDGLGVLVNSSRGILYAEDPGQAAVSLRDQINALRQTVRLEPLNSQVPNLWIRRLATALFEAGCVRFGDFVLHSGAHSPVYIDLRRLVAYPETLGLVARSYARLLGDLSYDRLAAIPYAGLPIGTAVSLHIGRPLIYPRKEVKDYGTRRQVEGGYSAGERVVVLDDLISSGESKLEAIRALESEGLRVGDVAVLIDREQGGREDLAGHGYQLHAVLTLRELVDALVSESKLDAQQGGLVHDYLHQQAARRA